MEAEEPREGKRGGSPPREAGLSRGLEAGRRRALGYKAVLVGRLTALLCTHTHTTHPHGYTTHTCTPHITLPHTPHTYHTHPTHTTHTHGFLRTVLFL